MEIDEVQPFVEIFQCVVETFTVKYLGIHLHFGTLKREDLQPLIECILSMITVWRGKLLIYAPKNILIQSYLSSIHIFLLPFIKFLKWALKLLDTQLANFMGNGEGGNHKIHLAHSVCMKKEFGGPSIPKLQNLTIFLIGSWI
jgi:hypothetical protein